VSVDKTCISAITRSDYFSYWKTINPNIEHVSCVNIAIGELLKTPTYFARLYFTAAFELHTINLLGNPHLKLPKSTLSELTKKLSVLQKNLAWFEQFTAALNMLSKQHG
jgi:hypothetical protein